MKKLNNDYNPRIAKKAREKNRVLESVRKLSDARKIIISFFEKGTFPYKGNVFKTKKEESEEESEKNRLEKIKDDYKKSIEYIENESKSIKLNMNCLEIMLILYYLVLRQKNYSKQKIKTKTMS